MKLSRLNIILILLLVLGFYLRSFHLDFSSIGYHNMKENEYLSAAYHYYQGEQNPVDYLRRRMFLCNYVFNGDKMCYHEEFPQMPLLPWIIALLWKIFGLHFWVARIIVVLFSLGSIVLVYKISELITENNYISLLSAFFMAVLPLSVFFGRNLQPESPALFFLLLSIYYFIKWNNNFNNQKNLIKSGLALCMSALFKSTFLVGIIPLLSFVNYSKLKEKNEIKRIIKSFFIFALTLLPWLLWNYITKLTNTHSTVTAGTINRIDLLRVLSPKYWIEYKDILWSFVRDNYTPIYFWLFVFSLMILLLLYKNKMPRFLLFYVSAFVPYAMILSDYVKGHSYYQMPFLPLVCFSLAYLFYVLGYYITKIIKIKYAIYLPLIIIPFTFNDVANYTNVQYDTIFFGLDTAADYIKLNSNETQRFLVSGHAQSYGVCFNSNRYCYPVPENLTVLNQLENDYHVQYIFIDGYFGLSELQRKEGQVKDYVFSNYSIAQAAIHKEGNNPVLQYLILRKGGKFNLDEIKDKQFFLGRVYELTKSKYEIYLVNN